MGRHVAIARCSCGGIARYRPKLKVRRDERGRLIGGSVGYVQCIDSSRPCGKDGPERMTRDEAVRAWNQLRALEVSP